MDISLIAKLKQYDEFQSCYKQGDAKKEYGGKPLLFYSVSNNDPQSRYLITDFLLQEGAQANGINECGENLLHILLSRVKHDLHQTTELCKRLIDQGADVNQIDEKGRVPLQYLINMKYSDEELEPLYQIWFAEKNILIHHKNIWGKSPLELAKALPYRAGMLERMKKYE